MANFAPSDFSKMGMSFANWQKYAGIDDQNPWGEISTPQAPIAPPTVDATFEKPNYGLAPVAPVAPVSGLGKTPKYGLGLPQSTTPMSLSAAVAKHFDEEDQQ